MRGGKDNVSYYILYETQYEHIPGLVGGGKVRLLKKNLTENETNVQQRAVINQDLETISVQKVTPLLLKVEINYFLMHFILVVIFFLS